MICKIIDWKCFESNRLFINKDTKLKNKKTFKKNIKNIYY